MVIVLESELTGFVAITVKMNVPEPDGTPESSPVVGLRVSPGGSVPVCDHVGTG